jgi:hypothetical protein
MSASHFSPFKKAMETMHGSKGIGRDIYELAGMIDRTRNEIVDRSILSGKTLIQGDIKNVHRFKMNVVGAMANHPPRVGYCRAEDRRER